MILYRVHVVGNSKTYLGPHCNVPDTVVQF